MNVFSKSFQSFQISKQTIFSCFLITGILSIFFCGILESIDLWKILLSVFAFGYGSIRLAFQMSRRSNLERILCEAQKKNYVTDSILKNMLFCGSFWGVLSVSGAFLFTQYKFHVSDVVLFVQVSTLLALSEIFSIFGIAPRDSRR